MFRHVVRHNRYSYLLSASVIDLVASLVRDALWELMVSDWSGSAHFGDLSGLFNRFNRPKIIMESVRSSILPIGMKPDVIPLEWTGSVRRDILLHEVLALGRPLKLIVFADPWAPLSARVPVQGWPHSGKPFT
jgi:hypothetical protein